MSLRNYLHEKAEESRHNQTTGHLMFVAGAIFFLGGVVETILTTENPHWFLFFPYQLTSHPSSFLGLLLTLSGLALLILGIIVSISCALERSRYMDSLQKAQTPKKKIRE